MIGGTNIVQSSGGKDYVDNTAPDFPWLSDAKIYDSIIGYYLNYVVQGRLTKVSIQPIKPQPLTVLADVSGKGLFIGMKLVLDVVSDYNSPISGFDIRIIIDGVAYSFQKSNEDTTATFTTSLMTTGILIGSSDKVYAIDANLNLCDVTQVQPVAKTIAELFDGVDYRNSNETLLVSNAIAFNTSLKIELVGYFGYSGQQISSNSLFSFSYMLE